MEPRSMPRERVLVVEDEQEIQELVRCNLARERCDVVCAASGEIVRHWADEHDPPPADP